MPKTAAQSINYLFEKKFKCKPGILSVIHSFGAKLNRNPHVHLIVSSGWITNYNHFKSISFIPYKAILVSRKKYLLKHLKERCYINLDNPTHEIQLLNFLYSQKNEKTDIEKSRYIYFSKKARSFDVVLTYIWRYLKRPTISQSRIISYDWNNVTFSYKDKLDGKTKSISCSATDFIGLLLQHLPNKHFHMVYYHGIFANRCKSKYLHLLNFHFSTNIRSPKIPTSFTQRAFYFTGKNPLACSCGGYFLIFSIFVPWYPTKFFDSG